DFGIAVSPFADPTIARVVRGTPGYLSPEQAAGDPIDWRSDVFALGLVLYELCAGHGLMSGGAQDAFRQLAQSGPAPLDSSIPAPIRDLVRRMLALRPVQRSLPMAEIAEVLETSSSGRGGSHRDVQLFLRSEVEP